MLAALVAICMWVFLQTLDPRIPKWQQDGSVIGTNPGLGFRPMPKDNEESTLIWLQGTNRINYLNWYDNIMEFLDSRFFNVFNVKILINIFQNIIHQERLQKVTLILKLARIQNGPPQRKCVKWT